MPHILLVEDNEDDAALVQRALRGKDIAITRAHSVKEATALLFSHGFDAALVDYRLPDGDGLGLLDVIRSAAPWVPVVFLTGQGTESLALEALGRGAADYMTKNGDLGNELKVRVEAALARRGDLGTAVTQLALIPKQLPPRAVVGPSGTPTSRAAPAPMPEDRKPVEGNPRLTEALQAFLGERARGAAVFDRVGRPLAAVLPPEVDPNPLGVHVVGLLFHAQGAERLAGGGAGAVLVMGSGGALTGMAALPMPGALVMLFDGASPDVAYKHTFEAARKLASEL